MGDSTSVPTETAQELLASICYTLQFEMAHPDIAPRELLNKDLYTVLKDGRTHLAAKVVQMKRLWEAACSKGQADADTLRWIGCFLKSTICISLPTKPRGTWAIPCLRVYQKS